MFPGNNFRLDYYVCYFCFTLSCMLYCCSQVLYLYCLTFVSRCPFTVTSHCFLYVFCTIVLFVFFAFISIPYCSQVASSLSIKLKLLLTLCQHLGIKRHRSCRAKIVMEKHSSKRYLQKSIRQLETRLESYATCRQDYST